jgi:hypothetical protein
MAPPAGTRGDVPCRLADEFRVDPASGLVMADQDNMVLQVDRQGPVTRIVIGLPEASWQRLRRGEATTFDLTGMEIPFTIVLTGGKDTAAVFTAIDRLTDQVEDTA